MDGWIVALLVWVTAIAFLCRFWKHVQDCNHEEDRLFAEWMKGKGK